MTDVALVDPTTSTPLAETRAATKTLRGRFSTGHAVFIGAGLIAAVLTFSAISAAKDSVAVSVATVEIRAGEAIAAGSLGSTELSADAGTLDGLIMADSIADYEGWVAATTIRSRDILSVSLLREPASASQTGMRAMSIPIAPAHAAGGVLSVGDRIDVIGVYDGVATFIATDIELIAVDEGASGLAGSSSGFSVTLAVDADIALKIASAMSDTGGIELLRSTGSTDVAGGRSFDQNGGVVDGDAEGGG